MSVVVGCMAAWLTGCLAGFQKFAKVLFCRCFCFVIGLLNCRWTGTICGRNSKIKVEIAARGASKRSHTTKLYCIWCACGCVCVCMSASVRAFVLSCGLLNRSSSMRTPTMNTTRDQTQWAHHGRPSVLPSVHRPWLWCCCIRHKNNNSNTFCHAITTRGLIANWCVVSRTTAWLLLLLLLFLNSFFAILLDILHSRSYSAECMNVLHVFVCVCVPPWRVLDLAVPPMDGWIVDGWMAGCGIYG